MRPANPSRETIGTRDLEDTEEKEIADARRDA